MTVKSLALVAFVVAVAFQLVLASALPPKDSDATATIIESIPIGVNLDAKVSTYDGWMRVIGEATESIDIAAFYFSLTTGGYWPSHDGGNYGIDIYNALKDAHNTRGVAIRIVLNEPDATFNDTDAFTLQSEGVATVRSIPWSTIFGGGILHTKLLLVDGKHGYIGSCNFGWDSLVQVKELGVLLENAPDVIGDAEKVFEQYWGLAADPKLPPVWPSDVYTSINLASPALEPINGAPAAWWLSASPPQLCAPQRSSELESIVQIVTFAKQSVCVSVMDYLPTTQFSSPNTYFAAIDDALRTAAFRGLQVRMLVSLWNHSSADMFQYLYSLNTLHNVQVRLFVVPDLPNQEQVPFTRVNHAKYMVTDSTAYVTTQNWSGDYFLTTGGMGLAIQQPDLVSQLQAVFDRDWASSYAETLPLTPPVPRGTL